ncbi:hypothetical protein ACFQFC_40035 [Amorphoplanes digitatis]|uniref:Uncharacterized protein n=1 Tax=Actinoplanes digitatis TaxID=1868 RepID=A0A7W7MQA1_9ACTN|nr:hypothetical protein [Actinoplanes digitatis]MBB4762365.1 hypothetical protein [Actinoplanes digitatis]BFE71171.1 hypothetical protein GCM10020092_044720 [Actinoplanes digitatis]GID92513.1 hypothetical protein Adi01nite_19250 [Actinoplanes digitatis]
MSKTIVARVTVVAEDDTAADTAAKKLLHELHDLDDVVSVAQDRGPGAPEGARGAELIAVGTLIMSVVAQPEVITAVLTYLADWRRRQGRGQIEFRTGKAELILTNASDAQVDKLIKAFIEEVTDPEP